MNTADKLAEALREVMECLPLSPIANRRHERAKEALAAYEAEKESDDNRPDCGNEYGPLGLHRCVPALPPITQRDIFAAAALGALLSRSDLDAQTEIQRCESAWDWADQMIVNQPKPPKGGE